ncbi:MAG: SDR family oxidoreductase [candidate division Zixibacteria bacterium]|nr:SDR family oxidoreductase [candidate division Zixibacteria bacterium]
MKILQDKIALITGAGRGIGKATALLFAQNGANLILVSRTESELDETAEFCRAEGSTVLALPVDISQQAEIDRLFDEIRRAFSGIDTLINNAARFDSGLMREYDIARFRSMVDTNVLAPFYIAQKFVAMVDSATGGTIVNVSSFSGCFSVEKFPGFGAYNITKYGLWGLTEILALENKDNNIRVNQISPSGVDTAMFKAAVPPGVQADLSPADVAERILYLAGPDSGDLTGYNLMIAEPSL